MEASWGLKEVFDANSIQNTFLLVKKPAFGFALEFNFFQINFFICQKGQLNCFWTWLLQKSSFIAQKKTKPQEVFWLLTKLSFSMEIVHLFGIFLDL